MENSFNSIPQKLDQKFNNSFFEEDADFQIQSLIFEKGNNIEFIFYININNPFSLDDNNDSCKWKISIKNYREFNINDSNNIGTECKIYSEHIILSHYKKDWVEIYIKNQGVNLNELLLDFYELHFSKYENFILPEKYLKQSLKSSINAKNGIFADGPENIMLEYLELLNKYGKNAYVLKNENQFYNNTITNKKLKLLIVGNNYFIAENFEFQEL